MRGDGIALHYCKVPAPDSAVLQKAGPKNARLDAPDRIGSEAEPAAIGGIRNDGRQTEGDGDREGHRE
jgi:hypothetical protein